jgi:hypothetical protein
MGGRQMSEGIGEIDLANLSNRLKTILEQDVMNYSAESSIMQQ